MLRDAKGNRLFRRVEITVLYPDDVLKPERIRQKAGAKKGFSDENIDEMLMSVADQLEVRFPWWSFRMQPLAPEHRTARYNFICAGFNPAYKPPVEEAKNVDTVSDAPVI
jgi:hypothetical protein